MAEAGAVGAKIIDGKAVAKIIHLEVASGVEKLKAEFNKVLRSPPSRHDVFASRSLVTTFSKSHSVLIDGSYSVRV